MSENDNTRPIPSSVERPALPAAAARALAEAQARRKSHADQLAAMPREVGGRAGKDPVRYGDWEVKGLAADF